MGVSGSGPRSRQDRWPPRSPLRRLEPTLLGTPLLRQPPACRDCTVRERCTKAACRGIVRYMNEAVLERMAERLATRPEILNRRSESVEHPFGSIKHWIAQGVFLMRRLENVRGVFNLTALAYNMRRAINVVGVTTLIAAVRA